LKFFSFESVWKLKLWNIKSQFSFKLLFFWILYKQMCPSFLWTTNSYLICEQAAMLNLDIQIIKETVLSPTIYFIVKLTQCNK
jgi:hypothetical protein